MLLAANENYNAEQATGKKNTAENGGVQNMLIGTRADGIEVYETSSATQNLTWKQRKRTFLDRMENEYRGRTAKFVRNGHAYYATFQKEDVNKNIYGDSKSDQAGKDAKVNIGAAGDIFELVENAVYRGSSPETGKTIPAHKNVRYWDYFVKTVQIDGKVFDLVANVRKKATGEYVYSLQLNENPNIKAASPHDRPKRRGSQIGVPTASDERIPQTETLVKNPNIKYAPGHQFQMFENVEETDRLVAVHNKSVSGLRRMLQRGGVPFPSIAIKKAGAPHEGFGDISIVFPRSTIDRTSCHNCVQQKGRLEAFPLSVFLYFAVCKPYFLRV